MQQITAFKASDGKMFEDCDSCLNHEKELMQDELENHIDKNCKARFDEDWRAHVIGPDGVADYIVNNWVFLIDWMARSEAMYEKQAG